MTPEEKRKILNSAPFIAAAFIIIIFNSWACKITDPAVIQNTELKLTVLDIAVKEVYLKVETSNILPGSNQILTRNGQEIRSFSTLSDTIIIDTTVEQGTTYSYRLISKKDNTVISESNDAELTTLNPTGNNFNWQILEFGNSDPSYFNDVTILDDNNIWAVGEVYQFMPDGTFDPQIYGAVHYDGKEWKLLKIPYRIENHPPYPGIINAAYSVDKNLFFASPGSLLKKDGNSWKELAYFLKETPFRGQVSALWAPDSLNIYCSGGSGSIYYCTENGYTKLNSGTTTDVSDLWGYKDPLTGMYDVYLSVSSYDYYNPRQLDKKILKITDKTKVDSIKWEPQKIMNSIWTAKGYPLFAAGHGIFTNQRGYWKEVPGFHNQSFLKVRGTGLNDIFAVGTYGKVLHFNGIEWKIFDQLAVNRSLYFRQ